MCTDTVKIKLFVTFCSQFNCAPLWYFNKTDKTYNKLRVAYNNVFRFLLGLPRDEQGRPCSASGMFASRKVKSLQEILRNLIYKFMCRLDVSDNDIVCCTLSQSVTRISKLRKHWNRLLFVWVIWFVYVSFLYIVYLLLYSYMDLLYYMYVWCLK